jgi:hypothetical protein
MVKGLKYFLQFVLNINKLKTNCGNEVACSLPMQEGGLVRPNWSGHVPPPPKLTGFPIDSLLRVRHQVSCTPLPAPPSFPLAVVIFRRHAPACSCRSAHSCAGRYWLQCCGCSPVIRRCRRSFSWSGLSPVTEPSALSRAAWCGHPFTSSPPPPPAVRTFSSPNDATRVLPQQVAKWA